MPNKFYSKYIITGTAIATLFGQVYMHQTSGYRLSKDLAQKIKDYPPIQIAGHINVNVKNQEILHNVCQTLQDTKKKHEIILSGERNSGKTMIVLKAAKELQDKLGYKCVYCNMKNHNYMTLHNLKSEVVLHKTIPHASMVDIPGIFMNSI